MNKLTTSLMLVSTMLVAGTSQAAIVNFSGEVTSQTCKFEGLSGGDFHNVAMGSVSQGLLQTVGQTAGATPFSISLSGCTTNDDIDIKWGAANADQQNAGTLKNTESTGAAQNVNIQLLKVKLGGNEAIDLNNQNDSSKQHVTDGAQTYTFNYIAQFYATGASKAGSVKSNATIDIAYP